MKKGIGYNTRHGLSKTRFYHVWKGMRQRCYREKNDNYMGYGGRGIKILWDSFLEFKVDMYDSYKRHAEEHGEKNTTIDRIDTNGNYSKENCRWATPRLQGNNRKNNRFITYNNKTLTIREWCRELNLNYQTVFWRIHVRKDTPERAFTI